MYWVVMYLDWQRKYVLSLCVSVMCGFDNIPQVMKWSGETGMEADRQNVSYIYFLRRMMQGHPLSFSCVFSEVAVAIRFHELTKTLWLLERDRQACLDSILAIANSVWRTGCQFRRDSNIQGLKSGESNPQFHKFQRIIVTAPESRNKA